MKEKRTWTINVDIENIEVSERYYSFDYKIFVDGKLINESSYSNDYCNGDTPKKWKSRLEKGIALELALEDFNL